MTAAWAEENASNAGARATNHAAIALVLVFARAVTALAQPIPTTSVAPAAAVVATAKPAGAAAKRNVIIVTAAAPAMRVMAAEHGNFYNTTAPPRD